MGHQQIKELFFENPNKDFYLRQIARLTRTPKTTAASSLKKLIKEKIVIRKKDEPFDKYRANVEESLYKFYKTQSILEKIHKSGIIDYIVEQTHPRVIILFGSCAKGDYDTTSDIDLFIQAPESDLDFERFKLNHEINPMFYEEIINIGPDLRWNILNGIKIYGLVRYDKAFGLLNVHKRALEKN
ncbi:MAG: nucleotidyltransferase domain-containing protein [archaeon]